MRFAMLMVLTATLLGCTEYRVLVDEDARVEDAYYSAIDAQVAPDAIVFDDDAGMEDAGHDAMVVEVDSGLDGSTDAGYDAGTDSGQDAGQDSGPNDSGTAVDAWVHIYSTQHRCDWQNTDHGAARAACPGTGGIGWFYMGVFQCCANCIGDTPECLITPEFGEGWYAGAGAGCATGGWVNTADCR